MSVLDERKVSNKNNEYYSANSTASNQAYISAS